MYRFLLKLPVDQLTIGTFNFKVDRTVPQPHALPLHQLREQWRRCQTEEMPRSSPRPRPKEFVLTRSPRKYVCAAASIFFCGVHDLRQNAASVRRDPNATRQIFSFSFQPFFDAAAAAAAFPSKFHHKRFLPLRRTRRTMRRQRNFSLSSK